MSLSIPPGLIQPLVLTLLVLQMVLLVLLMRASKADTGSDPYLNTTAVALMESMKLGLCFCQMCYAVGSVRGGVEAFRNSLKNPTEVLKVRGTAGRKGDGRTAKRGARNDRELVGRRYILKCGSWTLMSVSVPVLNLTTTICFLPCGLLVMCLC